MYVIGMKNFFFFFDPRTPFSFPNEIILAIYTQHSNMNSSEVANWTGPTGFLYKAVMTATDQTENQPPWKWSLERKMKKENFYRCQLCAKPSSQTRLKGCATWPRKGCGVAIGEAIGDVTYLKPFRFYLFCTHLLFCRLSAYFDFWQPAVPMQKLWKFMLMLVRSEFWASEKDQTGRTGISLKMWARAFSQSEVLSIGLQKSYRCFHIAAYRGGQQDLKKIITLMGWEANAVRYLRRNRKALQCFLSYLNLKYAGANVFQITLKLNPLLNNGTPLTRRIWENGDPTFSIAFTIHQFAFSSSLGWFRSFTDCQFAFHIMKGTTTIMQSHVGRWMEMCGFWGWKLVNNRKHATTGSANNNNSHSKSRKSMFFFVSLYILIMWLSDLWVFVRVAKWAVAPPHILVLVYGFHWPCSTFLLLLVFIICLFVAVWTLEERI